MPEREPERERELTPRQTVAELDRDIVGQADGQAGRRDRAAQPVAAPAA